MPRVASHDDALLMLYDLDGARVDFTHVYAPQDGFEERALEGNWLVLRAGRGFAAFTASAPVEPVTAGPGRDASSAPTGEGRMGRARG